MSGSLFPTSQQFFDNNGDPLVLGQVFTYIAGTSTLKTSYSDYMLTTPNANPVILDAAGRAELWGQGGYKVVVKTAGGATLYTQDDVHLSGLVATVLGSLAVTATDPGDTFIFDHTASTTPYPFRIQHSNVWSNSPTPYGTGSVVIEATGLNNNQPLVFFRYNVNDTSFGNCGPVITNIGGSDVSTTANSALAATLELVSNNPLAATATSYNAANGKFEIGVVSGRDTGNSDFRDGYFYISPRRGPLNPSGTNTGFDGQVFAFLPATVVGGARFLTQGTGIEIKPKYDYTTDSVLKYDDAYNNSIWSNTVTLTGKYARIENTGMGDSYIRNTSKEGDSQVFVQSDDQSARLELRSNWITPGTSSAFINLYVNSNGTGYRFNANGSNSALNIRRVEAGVTYENIDINPGSDGLVSVYRNADYSKGRLRLGNGSGAAGGGTFEYDSNTGILSLTGTYNYITMGNAGLIEPNRLSTVAPSSGDTVQPHFSDTNYIITSGLRATLTIELPTDVNNGHELSIISTGGVTALTVTAAGGATILGAPTTLAANGFFTMIYRTAVTTWYRKG